MDPEYWVERIIGAFRKYESLKTPKYKARYIVDSYSIFIQLAEIVVIHMHTLTQEPASFLHTLAIRNDEIRDFAEKITKAKGRTYLHDFVENFSYKIRGAEVLKTSQKSIARDVNLLVECISEYLKNYDFLNSYKHGYRLSSMHGQNSLTIGRPELGIAPIKIFEGDSQLTYYKVTRKGKGLSKLEEISTSFTAQRVFGRALFLASLLYNIRLSELRALGAIDGRVKYSHFDISDTDQWRKAFGGYQFKQTLFRYISKEEIQSNN